MVDDDFYCEKSLDIVTQGVLGHIATGGIYYVKFKNV